jgi:hypothetical protein
MPKCSECGLLAVWRVTPSQLEEASQHFRDGGKHENIEDDEGKYQPKCFVREWTLHAEAKETQSKSQDSTEAGRYAPHVKHVIQAERPCSQFTPWLQGFSPKEHVEMKSQADLRKQQRCHENRSLSVAVLAVAISAAGIIYGAKINHDAAEIEAAATRDSARQQIEAIDRQTTIQIQAQKELTQMQIDAQKAMAPPASATTQPDTNPAPPAKTQPRP